MSMPHRATLQWTGGGYQFAATTGGGFQLQIGVDEAGNPVGARAKELVCLGLGACSGTNLVSLMKKMRQKVERIDIEVEAEQADTDPMVFTHVVTRYRLYGQGIDPAKVKKALDYIEEKYCGVLHMVNKTAKTEYAFEIVEVPSGAGTVEAAAEPGDRS
jgi:putative redox protein